MTSRSVIRRRDFMNWFTQHHKRRSWLRGGAAGRIHTKRHSCTEHSLEGEPAHTGTAAPVQSSPRCCEKEANTHIMIKAAWTAAIVIVVAWPLLFWGKPALPDFERTNDIQSRLLTDLPHRQELLR